MPAPIPRRPNILFLMSDEHRADVAGFAGNRIVRTPVLDRLAATGVVFRNCYTPSPICIPARQCLMAGQLPRTCQVERYGQDLPPFSMTFAEQFARHGYHTVCCGKLHHMGRDQMQGWSARPAGDLQVHEPFRPGRDGAACAAVQAGRPAGTGKWSDAREIIRTFPGETRSSRADGQWTAAACAAIDDHFADIAYDRPAAHQPLLLKVSLVQPHYPYACPPELLTYYLNRVQPFLDQPVFDHPFLAQRQVTPGDQATAWEIRRATAAYYGMVETIDGLFGSVLDRLRAVGQDPDDWIIIYTSDHGEMLGEHGIWEKQKFFEASVRVPLIIRYPYRYQHRVVDANVNLCDIFATLCQMTGVPLPAEADTVHGRGLDSRSMLRLLDGDIETWSDESISQFGGTDLMIKRGSLKYQFYDRPDCATQPEVLFNLHLEPDERRNLIAEPDYAGFVAEFRRRRAELGFGPQAVAGGRAYERSLLAVTEGPCRDPVSRDLADDR